MDKRSFIKNIGKLSFAPFIIPIKSANYHSLKELLPKELSEKELWEEIYARHNLHPVQCEIISPEASGWFRKEITSIDDLKGLKMRFFGLGAKVMDKVGASTQLLAGGDIYPALELGTIDATEFAMPSIDLDLGFYQIA